MSINRIYIMAEGVDEEGPERCLHCGKEVMVEFDFCPFCGKGLRVMKIPPGSYHPSDQKKCEKCAAVIEAGFNYCPYCGHRQGSPMKKEEPVLSGKMIALYLLSFLVPVAGVIIWLSWKKDPEGGTRNEGDYCLGSAFLGLIVYVLVLSIYF
jgi:hypothetical protein